MNRERLDRTAREMERMFVDIRNSSILMSVNPKLRRRYIETNPIQALEAIEVLQHIKRQEKALSLIVLTFINDTSVYTSEARFDQDFFLNQEMVFSPEDELVVKSIFREPFTPRIITGLKTSLNGKPEEPVLVYTHQIAPSMMAEPQAAISYFISRTSLTEQLIRAVGPFDGLLTIQDSEGNDILNLNTRGDNQGTVRSNGKNDSVNKSDMVLLEKSTDFPDFRYQLTISQPEFIVRLSQLKKTIGGTLIGILIAGLMLSIFTAYRNYKPIRQMMEIVKSRGNPGGIPSKEMEDEVEQISLVLSNAYDKNDELQELINFKKEIQIHDIFVNLLKRDLIPEEVERMTALGIPANPKESLVCVITLLSKRRRGMISDRERLLASIKSFNSEYRHFYSVELLYREAIAVIIIPVSEFTAPMDREKLGEELYAECKVRGISSIISMGSIQSSWNGVRFSFLEALSLLESSNNKEGILQYNKSCSGSFSKEIWFPKESLDRLIRSIQLRSQEHCHNNLVELISIINKKNLSPIMIKAVCSEIGNATVKALAKQHSTIITEQIEAVVLAEDLPALKRSLDAIFIGEYFNSPPSDSPEIKLANRVEGFLKENYLDKNFNLSLLADEFQVSIFYMSRFFQRNMGIKFSGYLQQLRLSEAERLLMNTDKTIQEIASIICYQNSSHFIRSFKTKNGITPAEFRRRAQRESSTE